MNVATADPTALRLHPLVKCLPEWSDDDARFVALQEDIRARGIDQPIIITSDLLVIDGRHRWRAARRLRMQAVPVDYRDEGEAPAIALHSLIQRRHYTKGALAYLAYPLLEPVIAAASERQKIGLKKGSTSPFTTEWCTGKHQGIEQIASNLGIGRETLLQAKRLHEIFESDPEFRAEAEPDLLEGVKGLGALIAGYGGKRATKDKPRPTSRQLDLFEDGWDVVAKRAAYWDALDDDARRQCSTAIRTAISSFPDDLLRAVESAIRARRKEINA